MGFWNGQSQSSQSEGGGKGPQGPAGVGFKLTRDGNFNLENKKMTNVAQGIDDDDAVVMHQFASLDTGLKTELSQLRSDSLQVDGSSHMTGDLDLRGNKLILPGEINMNRKLIKNLDVDENDDLSAVNMVTLKKFSSTSEDINLQNKFNVKNSKQQNFSHLAANYDNLVSYSDVKNIFLSRKETFPMEAGLDMGNQTIFNVKDPTVDDQGANMRFVNSQISKFAANPILGETNLTGEKIINLGTPTNDDDAATKSYVDDEMKKHRDLAIQEGLQIQAEIDEKVDKGKQIDMKGEKIINLGMPTGKNDAASRKFVILETAKSLLLTGGKMIGGIDVRQNKIFDLPRPPSLSDAATKEYVDQSFVDPSGSMKNVFQYIMDDVDETSSESNITVLGILDFPKSPHVFQRKAIKFARGKMMMGINIPQVWG